MRRIVVAVVALACLACGAVGEDRIGPFLTGMTSLGDKSGGAVGGGIKYEWLSGKNVGLDLHAGYLNDGTIGLIPLEFGPVILFPLESVAWTLGAGGLYAIPIEGEADAALGLYAAAGIRGPISPNMEWLAEAQYVYVKGEEKSGGNLDFSGAGLSVGILWIF